MVVVKAVILTILILLSLLNDTSLAVPGALAQCLQCRRGLSNGHSFEKSRRQRKEKKNKKRKGENSGPLTNCVFYLMTGAQHFFQQTVKEGVHSEMKIFVFGLATSNELGGGVTKKNTQKDGTMSDMGVGG